MNSVAVNMNVPVCLWWGREYSGHRLRNGVLLKQHLVRTDGKTLSEYIIATKAWSKLVANSEPEHPSQMS